MPPVPWRLLSQRLKEARAIPFLGAGASAYRDISPSAECCAAEGRAREDIGYPPSGAELLAILADDVGLGDTVTCQTGTCHRQLADLARVASFYQLVVGTRTDLDHRLRERLSATFKPNGLHRLLADAARTSPMLIITTNYDGLIEAAFDHPSDEDVNGPVPYEVVATAADHLAEFGSDTASRSEGGGWLYHRIGGNEASGFRRRDPQKFEFDITERSVIYKIHGSIPCGGDWEGGYLIAEEDYARFLGRMDQNHIVPPAIRSFLGEKEWVGEGDERSKTLKRSFFFFGYGLRDWNLRVLLDGLGIGQRAPNAERHYAFMRSCEAMETALLEKRNTVVFNIELAEVVSKLRERLT